MKIGFLGNMNNAAFPAVRYLRDKGFDVDLLIFDDEFDHFHPSADSFDLDYQAYTKQLSWGSAVRFLRTRKETILRDIAPYDVLAGNGLSPAYMHKVGRPLDIFIPYGDDLMNRTFYGLVSPHRIPTFWASAFNQRRGLSDTRVLMAAHWYPALEEQMRKYLSQAIRWREGAVPIYIPTYTPSNIKANANRTHWWPYFQALRANHDLMVMSHVRHVWKRAVDVNSKATDRLLRGWATFRKRNPSVKSVLVTLEYGEDVGASKALIAELGITDSVVWLPKMLRKDLMVGLDLADICCGYFENSWITGGVLVEAMVAEKPILGWRDDSLYTGLASGLYPMMIAREPEDIARRLEEFVADPQHHRAMGVESASWFAREVVQVGIDHYSSYFASRSRGSK